MKLTVGIRMVESFKHIVKNDIMKRRKGRNVPSNSLGRLMISIAQFRFFSTQDVQKAHSLRVRGVSTYHMCT